MNQQQKTKTHLWIASPRGSLEAFHTQTTSSLSTQIQREMSRHANTCGRFKTRNIRECVRKTLARLGLVPRFPFLSRNSFTPQSICEAALTLKIPAAVIFAHKVFLFCYKCYFSASQRRCQGLLSLSFSDFYLNCDSGVCQESDCRRRKTESPRAGRRGGEKKKK